MLILLGSDKSYCFTTLHYFALRQYELWQSAPFYDITISYDIVSRACAHACIEIAISVCHACMSGSHDHTRASARVYLRQNHDTEHDISLPDLDITISL
jgi:hypothetical protein